MNAQLIAVGNPWDYVVMIAVAALFGALGGLVFELLQERRRNTGTVELPGKIKGSRFYDLGLFASMLVGAVSAVAVLYFFPPEIRIDAAGEPRVYYDLVNLVALSLIVGSAGGAFLKVAQDRAFVTLKGQEAQTTKTLANDQIQGISHLAKDEAKTAAVEATRLLIRSLDSQQAETVREVLKSQTEVDVEEKALEKLAEEAVSGQVATRIDERAQAAQKALSAVGDAMNAQRTLEGQGR